MTCRALEKLREEGYREGYAEGYEEGLYWDLVLEWTKDGYSVQEIAKLLKKSEDFVRTILKAASAAVS